MRTTVLKSFLLSIVCSSALVLNAQGWKMKKATLMTPFSEKIDTANVLGEYPRPQMVREKWMNLNGIWQFQSGTSISEALPTGKLKSKILVPFPVESAISGVMEHFDKLWYRRMFKIPANWAGQRILIHFGAVDYESEVYINGKSLGVHKGGYDPFTYDITSKIAGKGPQEITVRVFDPTDAGGQPRGKQSLNPAGIMYTPTTGIWQTVWLEPVPQTSISDIRITPDVDRSLVTVKALTESTDNDLTATVEVKDGAKVVATFTGKANTDLQIPVANPKLWSPDSPFLYDLTITLKRKNKIVDTMGSYFGMRKISVAQVGDFKKMMLNDKFLFQIGPLDQGFWPDGIYTAPTDLAIKNDIQKAKDFGFNMIRKHIKVEPYRWYYWADKLGILVWQDMPSANSYTEVHPPVDEVAYKSELERIVKTHWNIPSIIMWVVFNEAQGQHNTTQLVSTVKALDPSRLVNQASGGGWEGAGDVLDVHSYPPPAYPISKTQALACGEYGGIGYIVPDHIWKSGPTYVMVKDQTELTNMYESFMEKLIQYKTMNGLSAAVYTELTDVEVELNGVMTYDRKVSKMDPVKLYKINQRIHNEDIYIKEILPTSLENGRMWKYTTTQPAPNWFESAYDDSKWTKAIGGFGTTGNPGVRTGWDTSDIWIRQEFTLGELSPEVLKILNLYVQHDEDCEIYLNGVLAATAKDYTNSYVELPISSAAKKALKANGLNTISVHCHQTIGGQYIDAGLSYRVSR